MMKLGWFATTLLAGSLFAGSASAANVWSTSTNLQVVRVDIEASTSDTGVGQTFISFNSTPLAHNCSQQSTSYWKVGGDPQTVDAIRSAAIAAKLAGAPVIVAWNNAGGSVSCTASGYPILRVFILTG